jgi:AcrR family transcriptional regulator
MARREDSLSRDRIVAAAIEMLDAAGESGLTFRALSARLHTGAGAIYWHVANKSELMVAAGDAVLAPVLAASSTDSAPPAAIRALALGIFDAIEAHPWLGFELSRSASPSALLRILERIGRQIQALGVPAADQFGVATALLSYILGVGRQNAAQAADVEPGLTRPQILGAVAAGWEKLDPDEFPFIRGIAADLPGHDDREQFLGGVDLFLAGVRSRFS